jgi:hypothetical protein
MSGLWLVLWCASGGLVGWVLGARTGRGGVGLLLGTFMGFFGWVLILGAEPRAGSRSPLPWFSTFASNRIPPVSAMNQPHQ